MSTRIGHRMATRKRLVVRVEVFEIIEHRGKEKLIKIDGAGGETECVFGTLEVVRAQSMGILESLATNYILAASGYVARAISGKVAEVIKEWS